MPDITHINGLPLPRALLDLAATGRWRSPARLDGARTLFPDCSEVCLYPLHRLPRENDYWPERVEVMGLGQPDKRRPPGDIDPARAVLIGDLGVASDQPIALDYRTSADDPAVIVLIWTPHGFGNRWQAVAPNVARFAAYLGL